MVNLLKGIFIQVMNLLIIYSRFDVAGAGACLKRYTDPSFFKAESAFSGTEPVEGQREKKVRKVKVPKGEKREL